MEHPPQHHQNHWSGDPHAESAPWQIDRPQQAFQALADSGAWQGRVLDVGCGTGEHTLLAATLGLDTTGIDLDPDALRIAEEQARLRGVQARFLKLDALRLVDLGERYDTALDSLFSHALSSTERATYLEGLRTVVRAGGRLFVLCYSDVQPAGVQVPHGRSEPEVKSWFGEGWRLDSLEPTSCSSRRYPDGVAGQLAAVTRL